MTRHRASLRVGPVHIWWTGRVIGVWFDRLELLFFLPWVSRWLGGLDISMPTLTVRLRRR